MNRLFPANDESFDLLLPKISTFEQAIRNTLRIDVYSRQPLLGGVSKAQVYRALVRVAYPYVRFPRKLKKIVLKFSSDRLFKIEEDKYADLPRKLRKHFVKFSTQRKQVDGRSVLVMPYLSNYYTLQELLFAPRLQTRIEPKARQIAELLFDDLIDLQFSEKGLIQDKPSLVAHRLYLSTFEITFLKLLDAFRNFQKQISKAIGIFKEVCKKSSSFQSPFMTRIHGDCHSRNIMFDHVKMKKKFIDIDALEKEGDYLLDFGELVADLIVYVPAKLCHFTESNPSPDITPSANIFVNRIQELLERFAEDSHNDIEWKRRYFLTNARFLLVMLCTINPEEKKRANYILSQAIDALERANQK